MKERLFRILKLFSYFPILFCLNISAHAKNKTDEQTLDGESKQDTVSLLSSDAKRNRHEIFLNIGFGHIINRVNGLSINNERFRNMAVNGLSMDLQYHFYFRPNWGVGVIYSRYMTSWSGNYDEDKYPSYLDKTLFCPSYTGLMISGRSFISGKLIGRAGIGFGIVSNASRLGFRLPNFKFGSNCNIGVDYQLSRHWGIGVEIQAIITDFSRYNFQCDGFIPASKLEDKIMLGNRLNGLIGLRYYIR